MKSQTVSKLLAMGILKGTVRLARGIFGNSGGDATLEALEQNAAMVDEPLEQMLGSVMTFSHDIFNAAVNLDHGKVWSLVTNEGNDTVGTVF